jgi:hypothetical protein
MADSPTDQKDQEQSLELRKAIASAYAFVEGQKAVQSFSALTFEDLVDQQIEQIEGKGTALRPNMLDRLDAIKNGVASAIEKIKQMPPEAFAKPDPQNDVNTTPGDEEDA